MQFSQALDKGVLNGQELTSVMTQTPALAKAIADGLGVPIGALKEMGEHGELTAERVIGALEKVKDKIDIDYATTVTTVGNALEVLNTKAVKFVGELDKSVGGSDKVAKSILVVANNMDAAVAAGLALVGVWGSIKVSRSIAFHSVKLEQGTIPTDWTPTPEDVDSVIGDISADLTSYKQTQATKEQAQAQQLNTLNSKMSNAEKTSSLSAMGSRNLPKSVISLRERAR